MQDTLTFEQIPTFLLQVGQRIGNIEQILISGSPQPIAEEEQPIGVAGAAQHLNNLDEQTIYRLVRLRKIPHHKPPGSKRLYFYKSELNDWIRSGGGRTLEELRCDVERKILEANKNRRG